MQYRCYYFGTSGQLLGADTIDRESDGDALLVARKLFAQHAHATGYDLRHGTRSIEATDVSRRSRSQPDVSRAA